jgi:hypothetical protein
VNAEVNRHVPPVILRDPEKVKRFAEVFRS